MQAALTHSIPIKKAQTGLRSISLWGRISALNGRDYIIAEGVEQAHVLEGRVVRSVHYFFTQDGIKWADLVPVTPSAASVAANLRTVLNGAPLTLSLTGQYQILCILLAPAGISRF
jgi:radial spoke head protein 9